MMVLMFVKKNFQIALDSSMKDETEKPPNYYYYYFERCATVISGAHKVVDSVKLLTRAVEPFHTGMTCALDRIVVSGL